MLPSSLSDPRRGRTHPAGDITDAGTRPERRSDSDAPGIGQRWPARPVLAGALRALALLLPVGSVLVVCLAFEGYVAQPATLGGRLAWWVATLAIALVTAGLVERLARRLLPLAALLRLAMLFPDRAPSRFKVARTAGNPARLAALAADSADERCGAAAQVLALLTQLTRHDRSTRGHSERVRVFSDLIAEQLGIDGLDRDKLRWGALLHDIGKVSVPPALLNKTGRPTSEEWSLLQGHPGAGEEVAGPLFGWLGAWAGGITEHHERYDGKGYPAGRSGDQITLAGRIVGVADAYETMTAARSYKKPMTTAAARSELTACAGGQFDPEVVRAFLLVSLPRVARALGPLSWLLHLPLAARLQFVGWRAASGVAGLPGASVASGSIAAAALSVTALSVTALPSVSAAAGASERERSVAAAALALAAPSAVPAAGTAAGTVPIRPIRPTGPIGPSGGPGGPGRTAGTDVVAVGHQIGLAVLARPRRAPPAGRPHAAHHEAHPGAHASAHASAQPGASNGTGPATSAPHTGAPAALPSASSATNPRTEPAAAKQPEPAKPPKAGKPPKLAQPLPPAPQPKPADVHSAPAPPAPTAAPAPSATPAPAAITTPPATLPPTPAASPPEHDPDPMRTPDPHHDRGHHRGD